MRLRKRRAITLLLGASSGSRYSSTAAYYEPALRSQRDLHARLTSAPGENGGKHAGNGSLHMTAAEQSGKRVGGGRAGSDGSGSAGCCCCCGWMKCCCGGNGGGSGGGPEYEPLLAVEEQEEGCCCDMWGTAAALGLCKRVAVFE